MSVGMEVTSTVLVILGLLVVRSCGDETTQSTESTTDFTDFSTTQTSNMSEDSVTDVSADNTEVPATTEVGTTEANLLGTPGLYGGSYYNLQASNPSNIHFIHGTYQTPRVAYYINNNYYRDEDPRQTIDYYLGFGVSRMTDNDFRYNDFHHFYHDLNRTILPNESIPSDFVVACHPNATSLCPENTETVCLRNGTIYCMSKISVVLPCPENETMSCVVSDVPCVLHCIRMSGNFEKIYLPCLANVVIQDVYEDRKGRTLSKVGDTFVVVKALEESEKTFCVTVIVDPL